MKTAIIFASKHGTTEKCANILAEKIPDSQLFDLKKVSSPDIVGFESVIIGTSVYVGKSDKRVVKFLAINENLLKTKKLGLFMCCMHEGEERDKQVVQTFSKELREKAIAIGLFGGCFLFEKMNFFERLVIKMAVKIKESVDKIDYEAIKNFAKKFS